MASGLIALESSINEALSLWELPGQHTNGAAGSVVFVGLVTDQRQMRGFFFDC